MEFQCSKCGRLLSAEEQYAGMITQCPFCSTQQEIPSVNNYDNSSDSIEEYDFAGDETMQVNISEYIQDKPVYRNYQNDDEEEDLSEAQTMVISNFENPAVKKAKPAHIPPKSRLQNQPNQQAAPRSRLKRQSPQRVQKSAQKPPAIQQGYPAQQAPRVRKGRPQQAPRNPRPATGHRNHQNQNQPMQRPAGRMHRSTRLNKPNVSTPGWAIGASVLMFIRSFLSLSYVVVLLIAIAVINSYVNVVGPGAGSISLIFYTFVLFYGVGVFLDIFGGISLLKQKNNGRIIAIIWSVLLLAISLLGLLISGSNMQGIGLIMNVGLMAIHVIIMILCLTHKFDKNMYFSNKLAQPEIRYAEYNDGYGGENYAPEPPMARRQPAAKRPPMQPRSAGKRTGRPIAQPGARSDRPQMRRRPRR